MSSKLPANVFANAGRLLDCVNTLLAVMHSHEHLLI